MINALHDEIDKLEELGAESEAIVERVVKEKLMGYLQAESDNADLVEVFRNALYAVAAEVAVEHADLTTKAVQLGAEAAAKRYEASKQ